MRTEDLPYAPLVPQSFRTELAARVSRIQEDARNAASGLHPAANQLAAMLTVAQTALALIDDVTVPTVSTKTAPFAVNYIVLTYSEELDRSYVPPASCFAITDPVRTVTAVSVGGTTGKTVTVTYSGTALTTADAPLIAYTQVADSALRDLAGNKAADFTAAAVTVAAS